jgi:hypothetical protein
MVEGIPDCLSGGPDFNPRITPNAKAERVDHSNGKGA